jgi:fucose 4-O-acetylase-like acetyltransferase
MKKEINTEKKRDVFFDIAKGVAIISVVIGHCYPFAMRFVYSYHLLLFFFITGYFYNKEKYEKDPIGNIMNKLKNNYPKYFLYSFLFLILHNLLLNLNMIVSLPYSKKDFIKNAINLTMLVPSEILASALWFVPVMIYAISLFGILVYIGSKFKNELKSLIFVGFCSLLLGVFGLLINTRGIYSFMHVQTAILIVPVIFTAYLCRILNDKKIDFRKYLTWYGFILSVVALLLVLKLYPNNWIDLNNNNLFTEKMFFVVVVIGLYMSLSFTKIISKIKYLSSHIAWIGRYSFEIMAIHFLVFKIVDLICFKLNVSLIFKVNNFPISDPKLWFIYMIFGIYGSILVAYLINKMKQISIFLKLLKEKIILIFLK